MAPTPRALPDVVTRALDAMLALARAPDELTESEIRLWLSSVYHSGKANGQREAEEWIESLTAELEALRRLHEAPTIIPPPIDGNR